MVDINSLNTVQKEAVLNTEGPIMILAGAGSGKTRTLTTRISYLIEEKHISPYKVLALTFSNKAAKEMRHRVAQMVSDDIGALQITTFHAFCARVLRSESQYLGLSQNFTIYDQSESRAVIKTLLQRRGISTKEISPYEILYFIEEVKNHGFYSTKEGFEDEYSADEYYPFFMEYEQELHKANSVDFGGLISGVIELFEKFPEVKERYQKRFDYVLVDEYQDTNRAQYILMQLLSDKKGNLCVVGDEDQSIYSWRGADIRNILDFEKDYPDAKLFKLEQNYRSSKNIIEAATFVIQRNTERKGKTMWTDNPEGESIEIVECQDDKKEGDFVATEISKIHKKGVTYNDVAVFYRTNSQSRLLEDNLRKRRIPYRVIGGVKFYDRKEIKDLLAYLRIVVNERDNLALSRIINVPARGIGATSLRKIEQEALKTDSSLWESVENISNFAENYTHLRLSAKIKSSLSQLSHIINEVKLLDKEKIKPSILFEKILHETGYFEMLKASKDYESMARIENLEELGNALKQFEEGNPKATLSSFLETITLDSNVDNDENASNEGEVSLMTVHGSKGLEFPYVFVTGVEENMFPSYRSLEEGSNAEEEERRLFYVAMTRAMERLYLVFAQGRMLFGQVKYNGPSRFLHEIPQKLYNWKKLTSGGFQWGSADPDADDEEDDYSQETFYDEGEVTYQVNTSSDFVVSSKFPKGSNIIHSLYGNGLVLESEGNGSDEKVVIKFSDGTRKKFMVKFAPLVLAN